MGKKTHKKSYAYGLVGEKLGHSFSPLLHEKFGSYEYGLMEIAKEDIEKYFASGDFSGINVTIPYKEIAIRHCRPDGNAQKIGCVNTLVRNGSEIYGYNTDTFGFEYMLKRAHIDVRAKKVTILGSGGTCRTAAFTVSRLGAGCVTIVSRQPKDLGLDIACPVRYVSYSDRFDDCEVLINTTPVGMYPDAGHAPVDISKNYVNLEAVVDVIYNPLRTKLVIAAQKRGIKATGGLRMLVAQGYFASQLFAGKKLSSDPVGGLEKSEIKKIEKVTEHIRLITGNIVLVGMPGSGKTTVGKLVADKLGLGFADTDEIITKDNGISPSKCISKNGEEVFRALEKKAVKSSCQKTGRVIATGGGVVLDPENIEELSYNGTIVYIHRKLSELATSDRPLSAGAENLKALYYKRLPIYLGCCDMSVTVDGDAGSVAASVIDSLHKIGKKKKKNILVINGPNLNMLGIREPDIYGHETYADLMEMCRKRADELDVNVRFFQSNHEGDLVDIIHFAYGVTDGIVINPGGYTHTSVAILDALKAVGIPAIEVHISEVDAREEFRRTNYIRHYVRKTITGHGLSGYTEAMEELARL